jgi:hypothetical protein
MAPVAVFAEQLAAVAGQRTPTRLAFPAEEASLKLVAWPVGSPVVAGQAERAAVSAPVSVEQEESAPELAARLAQAGPGASGLSPVLTV